MSANPLARIATGLQRVAADTLGLAKSDAPDASTAGRGLPEPGVYVVRVTVHEVDSLTPLDWGGTSDPFVAVTCGGRTYQTEVVPKVNSAQYDASFIFELTVRQDAGFELETVLFRAVDSNFPFPDKLIGSYELELAQVWRMPRHRMSKEWMALVVADGGGCAGYVRVTVAVSGVNEAADDDDDDDGDEGGGERVVFPTSIKLQQFELVAEVLRADGLPVMDSLSRITGGPGTDPFVSMTFGASGAVRTEIASRTEQSKDRRSPVWKERLRLPVAVPTVEGAGAGGGAQSMLVDCVRLAVVDHDFGRPDVLVAQVVLKFSDIRAGLYKDAMWHCLYGPAPGTPEADAAAQLRGTAPGSQFRGRLLMRLYARTSGRAVHKSNPGKEPIQDLAQGRPEVLHRLRAEIYEGFGLPAGSGDVRVAVSLANVRAAQTRPQPVHPESVRAVGGRIDVMQVLSPEPVLAPDDPRQAPDVFIEVWDVPATKLGTPTMLCFARLRCEDLATEATAQKRPVWLRMMHGPGMDPYTPPAWLQVRVVLARGAAAKTLDLTSPFYKPPHEGYRVRATVFQARHLPAAVHSASGAADAYVVLRGAAPVMATSVRPATLFPLWWEPLTEAIQLPSELDLAPCLSLLVLDRTNCCRADALLAWAEFDIREFQEPGPAQAPRWHELTPSRARGLRASGAGRPEVLVAFELLEDLGVPPPRALVPKRRRATVVVTVVGLRSLLPVAGLGVQRAQVLLSVDTYRGAQSAPPAERATSASHEPSSDAPNFMEVISLQVDIPDDALFAPVLRVEVVDNRPFGARVHVGTAFVQLDQFLPKPWPPQSPEAARAAQKQLKEQRAARGLAGRLMALPGPGPAGGDSSGARVPRAGSPTRAAPGEVRVDVSASPSGADNGDASGKLRRRGGGGGAGQPPPRGSSGNGAAAAAAVQDDDGVDEEWKRGRKQYAVELERVVNCAPFDEFTLLRRGQPAGKFKGAVEVHDGSAGGGAAEAALGAALKALRERMTPREYVVRVYAIKATRLLPPQGVQLKDLNVYLRLTLGSKEWSLRGDAQRGTDTPNFRVVRQVTAKLPGRCRLTVQLWHAAGLLGPDVLLGQTELDLEDRVLSDDWHRAAFPTGDLEQPRTPIESRPLLLGSQTRGKLQMVVDILDPAAARDAKPMDVSLPTPQKFVMRVVVWGARDVPAPKHLIGTGMIDMYVRLILEGQAPDAEGAIRSQIKRWTEETDTHWRSKKGRGSFNWRAVFDVMLPMNRTRLLVQVWDHDILTPSGFIGQGGIELDALLHQAWRRYEASPDSKGAEFHWPDKGSRPDDPKKPKVRRLDHEGRAVSQSPGEFTGAKSAWDYLCRGTRGAYRMARSAAAEKGRGDGEWIELRSNKAEFAGAVSISVTVMHESVAAVMKAGAGRSEPNAYPKLPKPERVSWNPLRPDLILLDLVGPEAVTVVFVLSAFVLLAFFAVHDMPLIITLVATARGR